MKFSNRLEAYLSWISTGIKPEDFDDEPRNMTEYWLQGEADRLDRMSGNKVPVTTRSLKKGAGAEDVKYDYADLENKPIQPYPTDRTEKDFVDIAIGDVLHFDTTKVNEMDAFLKGLTYESAGSMSMKIVLGDPNGHILNNSLIAFYYPKDLLGTENDVYLLAFIADGDHNKQYYIYSTEAFSIQGESCPKGFNFTGTYPISEDGNINIIAENEGEMEAIPELLEQDIITLLGAPAFEENKYYFILPEVKHPVKNDEISLDDIANMNKETFLADISNFTYSTDSMEAIVTIGSTTPSTGEHDFNVFMSAMKKDLLGEQDEDIILIYMFYPVYASKHKNSSASGPFGSTIYFDENGWVRQMNDTPATYEMIVEQFKEMIKDTKLYYTSGHCDDAFEITAPANIFQYVDGEQKSLVVEGEGISAGLYDHQIKIAVGSDEQIFVQVLNSSSDAFTMSSLHDYLDNIGQYPASGWYNGNLINAVQATDYSSQDTVGIVYFDGSYQQQTWIYPSTSINDNIIKL